MGAAEPVTEALAVRCSGHGCRGKMPSRWLLGRENRATFELPNGRRVALAVLQVNRGRCEPVGDGGG